LTRFKYNSGNPMLLKHLTVQRFLSFDHDGIDLEMRDLNVLIGPNGSGKSNLFEVLAVLKAMPDEFGARFRRNGPARDWPWRSASAVEACRINASVFDPTTLLTLVHYTNFAFPEGTCQIIAEGLDARDDTTSDSGPQAFVRRLGSVTLWGSNHTRESIPEADLEPGESILSQIRDPRGLYPYIQGLQKRYKSIVLYRGWTFGPSAGLRRPQPADLRTDRLSDGGENLPLVLSRIIGGAKRELLEHLSEFMAGVQSFESRVGQGTVELVLDEGNGREIPATRLSDGTLRYLSLLAILLDPNPPALVAIEEPELGLHPDVLPGLGKLIKEASSRTQIFITTHSQILLDAFSETPEDVIVCSRDATGSKMDRLDSKKLDVWLKDHTLGELWNMGEIGGNRW